MKAHKTLPKTLFGTGKAEVFLVDTLNQLAKPNVTAKCMSMISSSRSWAMRFHRLISTNAMPLKDVASLIRLYRTEVSARFKAKNKELDQNLKDWAPALTNEAFYAKELEVKALKLAMNIASAPIKEAGLRAMKIRIAQIKRDSKLLRARQAVKQLAIDKLEALKLTPEQELEVLELIRTALRTPT